MKKPDSIKKVGDFDKYQRMMLVADSGFGKTVFGGTAVRGLFLSTDPEGTISAKAMGSNCDEWKIESWDDLMEAYRWLRDGGTEEYDWVIVDNISEAQNLGMETTMNLARKAKPGLDEFVPTQQDYQRSQNMLRRMVKQFNDLPINILWTAWQNADEDQEGNVFYSPGIHGQKGMLAQTIAGYMNINGYGTVLEKDGKQVRRIYFTHRGPYRGKDRFNALGNFKDDLTIPKLEAIIANTVKTSNTKAASSRPAAKKPTARRTATTSRKKA